MVQTSDLTDIVTMMRKVDACHDPEEANVLLTAGAQEIERLRALGRKIARPWIDGGLSAKEWCDAVDAFIPKGMCRHDQAVIGIPANHEILTKE